MSRHGFNALVDAAGRVATLTAWDGQALSTIAFFARPDGPHPRPRSFNDSVFYSAGRPSPPAPLPLRPARRVWFAKPCSNGAPAWQERGAHDNVRARLPRSCQAGAGDDQLKA